MLSELNNMSNKNSSQQNWTSCHHMLHKEILGNKNLIPNGANLLLAVSGGQDSMALLNLINDMKKHHNWVVKTNIKRVECRLLQICKCGFRSKTNRSSPH